MHTQKSRLMLVLSLCWLTYTAAYLCRLNISTALDKLSFGMGVSLEYLGMASSVYFVVYACGQLLNGIIGDRVNPHRFLMLAALMTGSINVFLGLQSSGRMFLLFWGVNGFCQSMFWGTLLRLLSVYAEDHQRKNVSTIMSTCSVTGYLLSWVVLSGAFQRFTYRPYFVVPGVIALLLVAAWFAMSRLLPFDQASAQRAPTPPLPVAAREFVHDRLFYICLLCMVIGAIQEGAVFWLPMVFTDVLQFGEGSLLFLMAIPLAKLAGVFLARRVLSLCGDNVRTAMIRMLLSACALSGILVLTTRHTSPVTVLLIAALIAVVNAANWYMISYLPLYFSERNMVATLGGAFDFSTYIGASLLSGALGVLLLRFGWTALPVMWLALTLTALLLGLGGAGECLLRRGQRRA